MTMISKWIKSRNMIRSQKKKREKRRRTKRRLNPNKKMAQISNKINSSHI